MPLPLKPSFSARPLWQQAVLVLALVYGVTEALALVYFVLAVVAEAHMRPWPLPCATPAEARAAGSFLDTVLVRPRTARYGPYTLVFDTCWVEQQRESRRRAWYAPRTAHPLPQAELRLRYHVEYPGRWSRALTEPPLLSSPSNYGSHLLDSAGLYTLPLKLRPDYSYGDSLPLQISLDAELWGPSVACFTARPAQAHRAPQRGGSTRRSPERTQPPGSGRHHPGPE